ncbi:MAG: hypothetical protein AB7G15_17490 [Alphaproteobacteria bacterium]
MTAPSTLLSIADAAQQLGITTIRLRQMIRDGQIAATRDNLGRARVTLPSDFSVPTSASPANPADGAAVDILIDEILELREELGERDRGIAKLIDLAERQQKALERAVVRLEAVTGEAGRSATVAEQRDRAVALAERAVAQLDQRTTALQKLRGLLDRAFAMFDRGAKP